MKNLQNKRIDEREKVLKIVIKWERSSSELETKRDRNKDI